MPPLVLLVVAAAAIVSSVSLLTTSPAVSAAATSAHLPPPQQHRQQHRQQHLQQHLQHLQTNSSLQPDARSLPSPLPAASSRRAARPSAGATSSSGSMRVELTPMKRPRLAADQLEAAAAVAASTTTGANANTFSRQATQKKRFKTSGKALASGSAPVGQTNTTTASARELWRDNDLNNNSIASDDNNNAVAPSWRRNVNSVNGTIDLSQYARNDVDRLYGDALLVYFKNFNETLPARRELISINGTLSSAPAGGSRQIPIYRSVASHEPK